MTDKETALALHYALRGKMEMRSRAKIRCARDMSLSYTPGVAEACLAIKDRPELSYALTRRWNTVAVITDGTAVLGLGDIGPVAGMPVMEGKCVLFKEFADIDAIPILVDTKNTDEIVETVKNISKSFGGINLEDISAPRCFEVERRLKEVCDVPVFHDDQHGTACVVTAGVMNALKVTGKQAKDSTAVVCGGGAAGTAITKMLLNFGLADVVLVDREGIINADELTPDSRHYEIARITNKSRKSGQLADAMKGADIFIGVSAPGIVSREMVASMNRDAIVFAMANPVPEIMPDDALSAGAAVVGTGRSDYPNQVNNVLAFPGIFRGALDARAPQITEEMKLAAAKAIAGVAELDGLTSVNILPRAFDERVTKAVAAAVAGAAGK